MPGRKTSPNHGKLRGIRPKSAAPPFAKGEKRTIDAAHKGGQARKERCARFRSLREAAEALRDIPAFMAKDYPEMSNGVAAIAAMYRRAQEGDPKAAAFLANLMGEMAQRIEVEELPTIVDDVPRAPEPPHQGGQIDHPAPVGEGASGCHNVTP